MKNTVVQQDLDTYIEKLADTEHVEDARTLLAKMLGTLGFDRFAYLALHLPEASMTEPVLVHSYSNEWVARYLDQDYATIDPVVETGLRTIVPFLWGGDVQRNVLKDQSRNMMDEATEFGLTKGFAVPIHGARGEVAVLSVALSDDSSAAQRQIEHFSHDLHLVALHFHAHMGTKLLADSHKNNISLSKREEECLLWSAQGKTVWETSEILKISEHTVRDYIKGACRKLGVHSKNHAVVKSMVLGLIKPNI